ncbi:hypothetical protein GK047_10145 [Paenibacillus sp. SYP-B3998]|uniref:Glycosyltransferase RgtA/B/C/D-like domain-containing protein n=1 Tax=Paenibacillus sp. SYP-B3998 TaxID=2678564 RepID=A0A6G3ZXS0_9BACL|nr:glycosyltransferase family 39 protein [Paenibacillus sp. SYP-B3998]NEW06371.1 hypothetical protein [Paenibacillus sp. SYP-B3998]
MLIKQFAWIPTKALVVAGILFFLFTMICSYLNTITLIVIDVKIISLFIGAICLIGVAAFIAASSLSRRMYLSILLLVAIAIRLVWILAIDTQPNSDFQVMYESALLAAQGSVSFGDSEYFVRWPYQIGFTLYQMLLIKLFGTPMIILKLFNLVFNVGTAVLLYLIAAKVFNEFCGRIAMLLFAMYTPSIILCSVLTNQHLSIFLFFLGSYFIIHKGLTSRYHWIFIGLSYGLGHLFRPMGSFYLLAFIAYVLLFKLLRTPRKFVGSVLGKTLGVVVVYIIVQQLFSYTLIATGVTHSKLSNNEPYWKLVVGLNQPHEGAWNSEDANYVVQYAFGKERNQIELQMVRERLADKSALIVLFTKKFKSMWGDGDPSIFWSLGDIDIEHLSVLMVILMLTEGIAYFLLALFGLLSLLFLLRRNEYPKHALFLLMLLGYVIVHALIEIQTRYRIDILPCLFILQSYGIFVFYTSIKRLLISKNKPRKKAMNPPMTDS